MTGGVESLLGAFCPRQEIRTPAHVPRNYDRLAGFFVILRDVRMPRRKRPGGAFTVDAEAFAGAGAAGAQTRDRVAAQGQQGQPDILAQLIEMLRKGKDDTPAPLSPTGIDQPAPETTNNLPAGAQSVLPGQDPAPVSSGGMQNNDIWGMLAQGLFNGRR